MAQKILIVLAAAILLSAYTEGLSEEIIENVKRASTSCQGRHSIPTDQLQSFRTTYLLKDDKNEAANCFVQCIMEEMGAVKNGVFLPEEKKKIVDKYFGNGKKSDGTPFEIAKMKKNVDDCAIAATGDTPCLKNYRIWACIQQRSGEMMS